MSTSKVAKALKSVAFTAQSSESHSTLKIRNILKWLKSGHGVKVEITGKPDHHKALESIYDQIVSKVKSEATVGNKVVKAEFIKFALTPTEEAKNLGRNETRSRVNVDEELGKLSEGKDIFSDEFEKDLESWARDLTTKNKKHS